MNTNQGKKKMITHALSPQFMDKLRDDGIYADIVDQVRNDKSLDMQFRGNDRRVDIYFEGKCMELAQNGALTINDDFTNGLRVPEQLRRRRDVTRFLKRLPQIKDKMSLHENKRREAEYEQLIIRANNLESSINSDYVILDRQYQYQEESGKQERWDLVAIYWPDKRKPSGSLAIIEVKYGTQSIGDIAVQVREYRKYLKGHMSAICKDMKNVLEQKLELRLIRRFEAGDRLSKARRRNLKNLTLAERPDVLVYLVDYNPKGTRIKKAMVAKQVRLFKGGLAMWNQYFRRVGK